MRIVQGQVYQGANLHLPVPAIKLVVEPDSHTGSIDPSRLGEVAHTINQAIQPLDNAFMPARMAENPDDGPIASSIGEFVAELALVLQRKFICTATQSRVTQESEHDNLVVVYESRHPRLGLLAGRYAIRLCDNLFSPAGEAEQALTALVEEFRAAAAGVAPIIETRLLLCEADKRGIPWFRIAEDIPVVQLGQGIRRRRFRNSLTDKTGDTAFRLASYKPLGAHLMRELGVPVPRQGAVDTEEQAVAFAQKIGFPVVVKPVGMDMGVGVHVGIDSEVDLRTAYRASKKHGSVQIEQHLAGFDYRFTFIRERMIGVVRTSPPIIEGDGSSTIQQLMDFDPPPTDLEVRKKVIVDDEVLGRVSAAGYTVDDVLPAGERIVLRKWWRNKFDHTLADVTAVTHPENIEAAHLAVQSMGLDVAGVDYITTDISRPFYETGGAFTEVNPMPAMAGVQRSGIPAYRLLLDAVFPDGATGRIDTAVLYGAKGAEAVGAAIETILAHAGHSVGIATNERLEVAGQKIRREIVREDERGRTILRHPRSTAAILQATEAATQSVGLALERCHVAVFLHQSDSQAVETDAALTNLLCAIADAAVVMDVDDLRASQVVSVRNAGRVLWVDAGFGKPDRFARRPGDVVLTARLDAADWTFMVDDGQGPQPLATIPRPFFDDPAVQEEIARALSMAFAASLGLGISQTTIAAAAEKLRPPSAR